MIKAISASFLAILILAFVQMAGAQNKATVPRIGVLLLGAPPNANLDAFIQGLRELGHVEGKNIFVEYRFAEGKADRLPELATELVSLKVDAIFTTGTPALFALKQATKTIPIVCIPVRRCCFLHGGQHVMIQPIDRLPVSPPAPSARRCHR